MIRTEAGRRGQDDDVAAFDDLLIGIWTGEDAGVIDLHLLRDCRRLVSQVAESAIGFFFECIGDGVERDAWLIGAECLAGRTCAATAAANKADFDFIAACGPGGLGDGEGAGGGSGANKLAA
jgi:hypothetical protein